VSVSDPAPECRRVPQGKPRVAKRSAAQRQESVIRRDLRCPTAQALWRGMTPSTRTMNVSLATVYLVDAKLFHKSVVPTE
jgi:hypothetical protein